MTHYTLQIIAEESTAPEYSYLIVALAPKRWYTDSEVRQKAILQELEICRTNLFTDKDKTGAVSSE